MKLNAKFALPAVALPLLLAACGTASTPEGTVSFSADGLRTEFVGPDGKYVACDNVTNSTGNPKQTAVGVYYSATGTIDSVNIGLRGAAGTGATNQPDSKFNQDVSGAKLQSLGGSKYRTVFFANSAVDPLPLAIVVNPNPDVAIKKVTVGSKLGAFYATLKINTASASASTNSRTYPLADIPVYDTCNVIETTQNKL